MFFFYLVALPFRKFKKITTKVVLDKSDCQPRNNPVKKKEQRTKKKASGLYGVEQLLSGQTGPENFLIYPSGDSYEANSAFKSFSLLSREPQAAGIFFHRMLDQTTTKLCLILFYPDGLDYVVTPLQGQIVHCIGAKFCVGMILDSRDKPLNMLIFFGTIKKNERRKEEQVECPCRGICLQCSKCTKCTVWPRNDGHRGPEGPEITFQDMKRDCR